MTSTELAAATGRTAEQMGPWVPHVEAVIAEAQLNRPVRLAMWLAQCGHESRGFTALEENLNYSAEALARTWPKRFPTPAEAESYARHPEAIANRVYGGRMGNGPEASGDGWRFRGRGLIQLTGRANYTACAAALGLDCVAHPELLAEHRGAALSAAWFWKTRKLVALGGDVAAVTRVINGGTNGLAGREILYRRALAALAPVPQAGID